MSIHNFISNKRPAITIIIKPDIVCMKFRNINRNCRNKSSHNSFDCIHRNTPDSKKSKNMINSKSIEIITHLVKPTGATIDNYLLSFFPSCKSESPSSGPLQQNRPVALLPAHSYYIRMDSPMHRIRNDKFRSEYLLLKRYDVMRIISYFFQLKMQMILNKIIKDDLIIMLL